MNVLEVKNLCLKLPNSERQLLNNVNFFLRSGDHLALIGRNGSGKSTLIDCLIGNTTPSSGVISIKGKPLQCYRPHERRNMIQILGQDPNRYVFGDLTAKENLLLAAKFAGLKSVDIHAHADAIRPGLSKHLATRASLLSGGERQALAVAMVLVRPPELLILDEHTSAIDQISAQYIFAATKKLAKATITITHHLTAIKSIITEVLELKDGMLVPGGYVHVIPRP